MTNRIERPDIWGHTMAEYVAEMDSFNEEFLRSVGERTATSLANYLVVSGEPQSLPEWSALFYALTRLNLAWAKLEGYIEPLAPALNPEVAREGHPSVPKLTDEDIHGWLEGE